MAKSAANTETPLSARCAKFADKVPPPGIQKPRNRRDHETHHLKHKIAHVAE
jgi:hypothetical protein